MTLLWGDPIDGPCADRGADVIYLHDYARLGAPNRRSNDGRVLEEAVAADAERDVEARYARFATRLRNSLSSIL